MTQIASKVQKPHFWRFYVIFSTFNLFYPVFRNFAKYAIFRKKIHNNKKHHFRPFSAKINDSIFFKIDNNWNLKKNSRRIPPAQSYMFYILWHHRFYRFWLALITFEEFDWLCYISWIRDYTHMLLRWRNGSPYFADCYYSISR